MPNPLEEDIWQQIREAYKIVDTGEADFVNVDSPIHDIQVYKKVEEDGIFIRVVY